MAVPHGHRNIKTIEGAHSAECLWPGTNLNLTGFNDFSIIGAGAHGPKVPRPNSR